MPPAAAALPLITSLAGPLLGAVGGSQGPRGQNSQFNEKQIIDMLTTNSSKQSGESSFTNFNQAIEDPQFAAFRESLLPMFGQEMNKVQKPIYGEAQQAKTLQDINDQYAGVDDQVSQQLAKRGQLGSGMLPYTLTQASLAGAGQRANFMSSLPMLEENARRSSTGALLQQGMGFAGRAPISQLSGGNQQTSQTGFSEQHQTGENTRTGTQAMQIQQPPLWQRMIGAGAGAIGAGMIPGLGGGQAHGTPDFGLTNPNGGNQYANDFSIMNPGLNFGNPAFNSDMVGAF